MKKATQEQAKALTLVFWDIIKCPVPDGCDPRVVRPSIKRLLENNGYCGPLTVTAIGKLDDVPIDILRELYSSGIHLTIAPFGSSDIRGLIEMDKTANFMVISDDKACSGLLLTLKAIGYNPLMPFPYGSLDLLIMEDSLVLEEETGDSALWDCLVCLHDPPAHGFENFITHLSSGEHKVLLMMPRNTVPRPPIDLSRVHVNHYLTERDLMRRNQLWTDERPTLLSTSVYQLKDLEAVKSKGETFVYWDIKLCPVPPYCDASLVAPRIKRFLKEEGFSGPLTIIAIGVLTDVPIDILRKVYSSGIALHIAPNGPSDIRSLIFDRVHRNGPLRNIMVISNDEYFANHFDLLHSTAFCNFKLFDSLPMEGSGGECSKTGESPFWFCSLCNFRNFPCQDIDSFTNHLSGTYHQRKLSDLLRMRSGHCLGAPLREPLKENLEAVTSVYWDIKMCPVPPGCDPRRVGPCIKRFLDNKGYSGPLTITAMGALEDVPNDILRGVHSSGIALNCIPYGFSISLERHIYEFMDWNPPPANIMVISDEKHSASNDVFGLQSKGYNFVEPVPCDSLESFFLAGDSGALEDDKCGETSLLGYLYCWVCCRDLDNFKNFTTHLTGSRHQRKLLHWSRVCPRPPILTKLECKKSVDMKKAQGVLV